MTQLAFISVSLWCFVTTNTTWAVVTDFQTYSLLLTSYESIYKTTALKIAEYFTQFNDLNKHCVLSSKETITIFCPSQKFKD